MTSPADLSTMVSYQCSSHVLSLSCTIHKLYAFFERLVMVVCRFRPLVGDTKPEVASPFDSSTTVSYQRSITSCV
jgi:hypothetical protein